MTARTRKGSQGWIYSFSVFLGAFLLFQVEPMAGKRLLPWYGGTPALWTTCLLFFQLALLAGYAAAHLASRCLKLGSQVLAYLVLVLLAACIPILPALSWRPSGAEAPIPRILMSLLSSVGPGFFALAAGGPLLQAWHARRHPGRTSYRLYAYSNAGSFLALLSYPFLVEPHLALGAQSLIWRLLFTAWLALCFVIGLRLRRLPDAPASVPEIAPPARAGRKRSPAKGKRAAAAPTVAERPLLWIAWSACGVMLFMSVTNTLSLDLAAVPFLWVMPLSIYLLSFVLAFSGRCFRSRLPLTLSLLAAFGIFHALLLESIGSLSIKLSMGLRFTLVGGALFALCLICHGELYRLRPSERSLTRFYLYLSLGGALGGAFMALVAPRCFSVHHELVVTLFAVALLFLVGRVLAAQPRRGQRRHFALGVGAVLVLLAGFSIWSLRDEFENGDFRARSFFGEFSVTERKPPESHAPLPWRGLIHGSTLHGLEFLQSKHHRTPTAYYGPTTAAGSVLQARSRRQREIGVVGLGVGTLAAYARPGDHLTFYEIDPAIVAIARTRFDFLADCAGRVDLRLGDARASLEREAGPVFDILVLDAFSGDAIPVHLLTREAMAVYMRHLAPNGIMLFHISNRLLDLSPEVYKLAQWADMSALRVSNSDWGYGVSRAATWIVLSRDGAFMAHMRKIWLAQEKSGNLTLRVPNWDKLAGFRIWTDDYSNLLAVLR